ncbi:hypothetical protein [Thermoflexus sp.]|uniref:hypothetical protein n=1 Tax=Thermoflexus sp. TaxID=1969742 RepID=UPI00176EEEC0|nr:hypothetical protein [Thermoflexus sp.]
MGIVGIKAEILHPVLLVVGLEAVWSPFKAALQQAGFTVIHRLNPMEALASWVSSAPDAILIASPLMKSSCS